MTRIALTGASGFLGVHLASRLVRDGHEVYALVRSADRAKALPPGISRIETGDIADPAVLDRLMKGADAAVHLVSNFRTASGPPDSYHRINVEGTRNALRAASAAGARRFVHCSTIGVHGHVRITPGDEESPFNPGDLYQSTKVEAEELVRAAMGGHESMEVVIVRPCSMYGPGDMRMLKMFRMLRKRRFLLVGSCQENFHAVYIDDIVEGFVRALTEPAAARQAFIIGGSGFLPLKEYLTVAAAAVGSKPPWIRLPYWPMYWASALCEMLCVPFGIEPPLHRRRIRFFRNNRAFRIDKARRELGYAPAVPLEEGMRRTANWYAEKGYL